VCSLVGFLTDLKSTSLPERRFDLFDVRRLDLLLAQAVSDRLMEKVKSDV